MFERNMAMKPLKYKSLVVFVLIVAVLTAYLPAAAAGSDDILSIELTVGSEIMKANGAVIRVEKPHVSGNTVYLPLDPILECFGAEIVYTSKGTVEIIYREDLIELIPGSSEYYLNLKKKQLVSAVRQGLKGLMVPLELITENFDVRTEYNPANGKIQIIMEDDGALTDLSFLTDSITKPAVGNSYFNWRVNVPSSSRIIDISFNSRYVCILNSYRGIAIEIEVLPADGKTLEEYYNSVIEDPESYLYSEPSEALLRQDVVPAYAEFQYTNPDYEAVLERAFVKDNYIYILRLTYYIETDPETITENSYLMGIINSFSLDYTGNDRTVQNLSTVEYGLVKFENYFVLDATTGYTLWEISVLPEWDVVEQSFNYIFLGTGRKEYISIYVLEGPSETDVAAYGRHMLSNYEKYMNPGLYKLISAEEGSLAGYKSYNIMYRLTVGDSEYIYDDRFVFANGLMYNLTVKAPAESYEEKSAVIDNLLETFRIGDLSGTDFKDYFEFYNSMFGSRRLASSDRIVPYQDRNYKWSLRLPGYWMSYASFLNNVKAFSSPYAHIEVAVEAVPALKSIENEDIEKQFTILSIFLDNFENVKTVDKIVKEKDENVRLLVYRIEDEEEQLFGELKCRIVTGNEYSYCFMTLVSDSSNTSATTEEVENIWASFTVSGR